MASYWKLKFAIFRRSCPGLACETQTYFRSSLLSLRIRRREATTGNASALLRLALDWILVKQHPGMHSLFAGAHKHSRWTHSFNLNQKLIYHEVSTSSIHYSLSTLRAFSGLRPIPLSALLIYIQYELCLPSFSWLAGQETFYRLLLDSPHKQLR